MQPKKVKAHPIALLAGVFGISWTPAFKAGVRSGRSEKKEFEVCYHAEKESMEEEKNPRLPTGGSPAQTLLEDLLMPSHTATEMPLSHAGLLSDIGC